MPEKNQSSLLLPLGAAGLLISGGVAAYWLLTQQHGLVRDLPVGANIIPQDALLTISLSTQASKWQQLREFGTKQTQAEIDKNLAQLRDRLLRANGYNYQQDIQPWVGDEITIAYLAAQNSPQTKNQQSLLMVLPIDNPTVAKQIWEKPRATIGKWNNRIYKGIQIRETQAKPAQNYSTVIDRQLLVISDNLQATQTAIDTYQGGASLAKTPGYTKALSKIATRDRFAQLYVNIPASAKVASANPTPIPPQNLTQLQNDQGVATTITLEPEGVRFKGIYWLQPNSPPLKMVKTAGKMQSRLPAETIMMLSGGNLQRFWQVYALLFQKSPFAPLPPQELQAGIESLTGLDLQQDLLNWMGGEFAVSFIPAPFKPGNQNDFGLSLVLTIQTSDRAAAEKSFQRLDQVMKSQYQFQIQEAKLKGQPVVNWISDFGTSLASHGWLDGDVAFFTLGAPIAQDLVPQPVATLASTEQFQQAVASELSPYNGQFFLKVDPTIKSLPLPQFFSGQQTLLNATRFLGGTVAIADEHSIRYDVFMALKKQRN